MFVQRTPVNKVSKLKTKEIKLQAPNSKKY